ncbi:AAA family ATPase [Caulobacter sp.]|uniref:AAA family ATPase n=1 Tax=Caulobacter sp. TaxID=78 RepID=UPI003BB0C355
MRIKSIELKAVRRFSQLSIRELPSTAKLVFLCGPNGSGKSSLFDGVRAYFMNTAGQGAHNVGDYMMKRLSKAASDELFPSMATSSPIGASMMMHQPRGSLTTVSFHSDQESIPTMVPTGPDGRMAPKVMAPQITWNSFYFRSAHRNEPEFSSSSIGGVFLAMQSFGPRTIDNDAAVSRNYQRLVSDSVQALWGTDRTETTFGQYREEIIGKMSTALQRLFPDLSFTGVGSPLKEGTFTFGKGASQDFPYRDLSGGEKAAFDILLDFFAQQRFLTDCVMCIDEPEAHLNARVHGELLSTLFDNIADKSQLWVASHSIGMMRRARDLALKHPGEVVFLDFEGHDFDKPVVMTPVAPDRELWKRALKVALDDIEELVSPEHIVICEGEDNHKSLDAFCYNVIFGHTHPEVQFVPGGSSSEVTADRRGYSHLISLITPGTKVTRLADRDDKSPSEIQNALPVRTLLSRNIESYLFGDGVLERFCEKQQPGSWVRIQPKVNQQMEASISRGNPVDDRKRAANGIYDILRHELALTGRGNSATTIAKEMLVYEIVPGTAEYTELDTAIFG